MRHRKAYNKLSKPTDQRMALLGAIANSAIKYGKIKTTRNRAKEAKKFVERIVALAKKGGLANLRKAISMMPEKRIVLDFFKSAPERFQDRPGGVTRITGISSRRGDNADMVYLELL